MTTQIKAGDTVELAPLADHMLVVEMKAGPEVHYALTAETPEARVVEAKAILRTLDRSAIKTAYDVSRKED